MSDVPVLHGFHRSSASYRVRIALNLKQISYRQISYRLRHQEHRSPAYLQMNPQGLVPSLELNGIVLTQSLAIIEWLDELHPAPPLLPNDATMRAKVRAFANVIASDVHPLQNLKTLNRLAGFGVSEPNIQKWIGLAIGEGLDACETLAQAHASRFCFGNAVSLAELCLIPQMANARRFGVELRWPLLQKIEENCRQIPAFGAAAPDLQPDFE